MDLEGKISRVCAVPFPELDIGPKRHVAERAQVPSNRWPRSLTPGGGEAFLRRQSVAIGAEKARNSGE
jgi:hypothetical protein